MKFATKTDLILNILLLNQKNGAEIEQCITAIMDSIQIIDGNDPDQNDGAIPEILSNALGVSFDQAIGHDYIDNADEPL